MERNCLNNTVKILLIPLIILLVFVTLEKGLAQAQVVTSQTINFQGKIVRNDSGYEGLNVTAGSPACVVAGSGNDTCDFRVSYFDVSSGGTALLTEVFSNVEIGEYGGVFNLALGSIQTSLIDIISQNESIYVQVEFAPDGSTYTETFTRMPLRASGYSMYSKYAGGANDAFAFSQSISSASSSNPVAGMVYYSTASNTLRLYNGTSWIDLADTGSIGGSYWVDESISSWTWSNFMETGGIGALSAFSLDTTDRRVSINGTGAKSGLSVYSSYSNADDNTWPLVSFKADSTSFRGTILELVQDSLGAEGKGKILVGKRGTDTVFEFDNSGNLHLTSNGIAYFEAFGSLPASYGGYTGEGCFFNVNGVPYWNSDCTTADGNGYGTPVALALGGSSLWTDGGAFTYLTATGDDLILGANTIADATFLFDVDASGGSYFEVDNADNTARLFTIDSSGNVGIGTATPGAKLDIAGATSVISNRAGDITISPAGNLILSDGRLGIGTSSPVYKLDTNGTIRTTDVIAKATGSYGSASLVSGNAAVTGYVEWRLPAVDGVFGTRLGYMGWDATNVVLMLENNADFVVNGGNVGIGTTSPVGLLNLRGYLGGTGGSIVTSHTKNFVIGGQYNSAFNSGNAVLMYIGDYSNDSGDDVYPIYVENENNGVDFYVHGGSSGGTGTAYFGGNVGIGTTSITQRLEVSGNIRLSGSIYSSYNDSMMLTNHGNGNVSLNALDGNLYLGYYNTGATYFYGGGSSKMFLSSNGNLGIGTTSPTAPLTVAGNIAMSGNPFVNNGSPTVFLQDTNHRSAMIQTNSNMFYILRGSGTNSTTWTQVNGLWPLEINLETNDARFGGAIYPRGFGNGTSISDWSMTWGLSAYHNADTYAPSYHTGIIWKLDGGKGFQFGGQYATSSIFFGRTHRDGHSWNGWVQFTTQTPSDRILKKDIQVIDNALEKIEALNGYYFYWKTDEYSYMGFEKDRQVGMLAQELELVLPEVVGDDPNGFKNVEYRTITALLLQGVKELNSKVENVKTSLVEHRTIEEALNSTTKDSQIGSKTSLKEGWYRIASTKNTTALGRLKLSNNSLATNQNIIMSISKDAASNSVNILSNVYTEKEGFSNIRFVKYQDITFLEVYTTNLSSASYIIYDNVGWQGINWIPSTYTGDTEVFSLKGISFNIDKTLVVSNNLMKVTGDIISSSQSNLGNGNNRWSDVYASGSIRLGNSGSEGSIRYNVEEHTLEFSNNGVDWISLGDLKSQNTLSPEYPGAVLYADGSDNYGTMTSDVDDVESKYLNYYQWTSELSALQDYDILVRITLPDDFVSWNEEGITLDFVTENSASVENNKVDLYLYGSETNQSSDVESKDNISKLAGQWQRISLKGSEIDKCDSAGETCVLKINMSSKDNYYVRVGDIVLNYNRSL